VARQRRGSLQDAVSTETTGSHSTRGPRDRRTRCPADGFLRHVPVERETVACTRRAGRPITLPSIGIGDRLAIAFVRRPAKRAGLLFLFRTMVGNPVHRLYLVTSTAIGVALLLAMAPAGSRTHQAAGTTIGTSALALQTLILIAMIAGFRAAVRTAADAHAGWLFGVADEGSLDEFRKGVRLGVMTAIAITVLLLLPVHAAAWDRSVAATHAVNGAAVGWLFVEIACADVDRPLVSTIPPNDGLNTVGVVFLGAMVIAVFVLAHIEASALTGSVATISFLVTIVVLAACARYLAKKNQRVMASLDRV
jgi:hypothetical protein